MVSWVLPAPLWLGLVGWFVVDGFVRVFGVGVAAPGNQVGVFAVQVLELFLALDASVKSFSSCGVGS